MAEVVQVRESGTNLGAVGADAAASASSLMRSRRRPAALSLRHTAAGCPWRAHRAARVGTLGRVVTIYSRQRHLNLTRGMDGYFWRGVQSKQREARQGCMGDCSRPATAMFTAGLL